MKGPPSLGYSNYKQRIQTERTKRMLLAMGFKGDSKHGLQGDLVLTGINRADNIGILVRPPGQDDCWSIQVSKPDDLLKISGTTGFHAKWSTPEKVILCVVEKLLSEGVCRGSSELRRQVREELMKISEALKGFDKI